MSALYWSMALICLIGCPVIAERADTDKGVDSGRDSAQPEDTGETGQIDDTADSGCELRTFWLDDDGDSFGDVNYPLELCEQPQGYVDNASDCDDQQGSIHPDATELCDTLDNDCDATIDIGAADAVTWYQDFDLDGFGNDAAAVVSCSQPDGYVATGGDCYDLDSSVTTGETWFVDNDSDGWGAEPVVACDQPAGTVLVDGDCDDADMMAFPGAAELCNGLDEDCDSEIDEGAADLLTWYADHDGDGYGIANETTLACEPPAGFVELSTDCNDTTVLISPGAAETCSGLDEDCDGLIDADDPDMAGVATWYLDTDGDGHGVPSASVSACAQPDGYALTADDCEDADATVFPGAEETCDGTDEDCDAEIDESAIDVATWYADVDLDGYGDAGDSLVECEQPADYVDNSDDCDDLDAAIYPEGVETCDGFDQDCDGEIDEQVWYADTDGDGYGDPNSIDTTCIMPSGYASDWSDCDDGNAAISPDGVEVCGGQDEDCDGLTDDLDDSVADPTAWYTDADGDGFGTSSTTEACVQPGGYSETDDDCDDADATVSPGGVETCDDGTDQDCDGADLACPSEDYTTDWGSEMIAISAGSFTMGGGAADPAGSYADHVVTLTHDFWIGETEITRGQWESSSANASWAYNSVTEAYPCTTSTSTDDCPADTMSWYDVAKYANALSAQEGLTACYLADGTDLAAAYLADPYACPGYRMPTEAEWEYAARAGQDTEFSGSNTVGTVAWHSTNASSLYTYAHRVATLGPNAWGLYDMSGNVWEWTNDWYSGSYGGYGTGAAQADPVGPTSSSTRVVRGGFWGGDTSYARVAYRYEYYLSGTSYGIGARLARSNP